MDKAKVMGFHQPPILFDNPFPIPKRPHIHRKMREGCRNDYLEAFGAVLLGKKKCFEKF